MLDAACPGPAVRLLQEVPGCKDPSGTLTGTWEGHTRVGFWEYGLQGFDEYGL